MHFEEIFGGWYKKVKTNNNITNASLNSSTGLDKYVIMFNKNQPVSTCKSTAHLKPITTWKHFWQYLNNGLLFSDLHWMHVQYPPTNDVLSSELLSESSQSVIQFSSDVSQIAAAAAAANTISFKMDQTDGIKPTCLLIISSIKLWIRVLQYCERVITGHPWIILQVWTRSWSHTSNNYRHKFIPIALCFKHNWYTVKVSY